MEATGRGVESGLLGRPALLTAVSLPIPGMFDQRVDLAYLLPALTLPVALGLHKGRIRPVRGHRGRPRSEDVQRSRRHHHGEDEVSQATDEAEGTLERAQQPSA